METEKLLLFLHIPKTAGTTINRMIIDQYTRERVAFLHEEGEWSTCKLVEFCEKKRGELQIVSGHFPFGIHEHLNSPVSYITFLRNPVELLLSMYHFFLREPSIPTSHHVSQLSFPEFVQNGEFDFLTSNLQTRYIGGNPNGFCHLQMSDTFLWKPGDYALDLDRAKDNLSASFSFVGITEWSEECFFAMGKLLKWKNEFRTYRENVTKDRPAVATVDDETVELIREKNQLDLQLYDYARALYRSRFASGFSHPR